MDTEKKLLLVFVLLAISVSSCYGSFRGGRFRSGYRGYYYYYSSYSSGTSTGGIIGGVVGGIAVIVGVVILIFILRACCGKRGQQGRTTGQMTTLSSNVQQPYAPPPYSAYDTSYKTGIDYNTKDTTNYLQTTPYPNNATPEQPPPPYTTGFSSAPYPDTTSNYPPQPYPSNNVTQSQEHSAQPLSNLYDSKPSYDNYGMTQ